MTFSELNRATNDKQVCRFMELLDRANASEYIMVVAILCADLGEDGPDIEKRYTKGDFKRAIKALRACQAYAPDHAENYEAAIAHIREKWLHKGVSA